MTAISIHVGLNAVDPKHYDGWDGKLRACENDARDMQAIAASRGYETSLILTADATAAGLLQALGKAATRLKAGDTLLLTYAGHGAQIPDVKSPAPLAPDQDQEPDGLDETWALFDRMIIDDELYGLWTRFAPGVRILVLSDSCHSGTITRAVPSVAGARAVQRFAPFEVEKQTYRDQDGTEIIPRCVPAEVAEATYRCHQAFYESLQWTVATRDRAVLAAGVILISGCQDDQTSGDGLKNGIFTGNLLQVWSKGAFRGNHAEFHRQIDRLMPPRQRPNYDKQGTVDPAFENQNPFSPSSGQPRSTLIGVDIMKPCIFTLDVDGIPDTATEADVRRFLLSDGCDVLMSAFTKTRQLQSDVISTARSLPRDGSASIGCSADSKGGWSCSGGATWRF